MRSRKSNGNTHSAGGATAQKCDWKMGFGDERSRWKLLWIRQAAAVISFWCVRGWGAVRSVSARTTSGGGVSLLASDTLTFSGLETNASNRHQLTAGVDTCSTTGKWKQYSIYGLTTKLLYKKSPQINILAITLYKKWLERKEMKRNYTMQRWKWWHGYVVWN